ncbi:probable inactive receptor kinase, partial [Tanacetum coccineum]
MVMCRFSSTFLVLVLNTLKAMLFIEYPTKNPSSAFPSNLPRGPKQLHFVVEFCNDPLSLEIGSCDRPKCQEAMGGVIAQTRSERAPKHSYDSTLLGVNIPGSDEERLEQHELMDNVPSNPHDSPLLGEGLESHLKKTKKLYATAFKKLINRVKSLEDELKFQKSKSKRRRLTLVTFEDEGDLVTEDPSKLGRILIEEMDLDAGISFVSPHVEVQGSDEIFVQQLTKKVDFCSDDISNEVMEHYHQEKKFFAQQRAEAKRNKPMSPANQKEYMSNYIKNQEGVIVPVEELCCANFAGFGINHRLEVYYEDTKKVKLLDLVKGGSVQLPTDGKEKELWIFRFCRSKCHKNFNMQRNPSKEKWTKAYRRLREKDMTQSVIGQKGKTGTSLRTHSRPSRLLTKSDPVGRRHTLRIVRWMAFALSSLRSTAMPIPRCAHESCKHEWNLTQLRTLSLRHNRLSSVVPSYLELCTELRVVNFQDNMFSRDIPTSLYRLRNLVRFDISGNNLLGVFPPDFGDLRKLTYLNVSMNRLSGRIPNSVARFPANSFIGNDLCGPPLSLCEDRSDDGMLLGRAIAGIVIGLFSVVQDGPSTTSSTPVKFGFTSPDHIMAGENTGSDEAYSGRVKNGDEQCIDAHGNSRRRSEINCLGVPTGKYISIVRGVFCEVLIGSLEAKHQFGLKKYKGISSSTQKGSAEFSVDAILDKPAMIEVASNSKEDTQAYSWGQKVVSGIEAAWGAKKTENETEKGWEHFLGIKRWSMGMRLLE